MPRRKTTEEYIQECKEKGYDLPVENYINNSTKIEHKCNKCGNVYKQTPAKHLCGHGCYTCGIKTRTDKLRKTTEEYLQECKEKGLDLPIEDYINSNTKINHKCKHGHIYSQRPADHLCGQGCPICGIENISKAKTKSSKEYLHDCKDRGYDLPVEDYIDAHIKIKHKCSQGHIYKQTPNNHLNGQGCPICGGTKRKTPKEYYSLCKDRGLDLPIEDYVNAQTKITHTCSRGHVYKQRPYSHLNGYGCPVCNESKGERFIRNYLDKNDIKYIPQKKFCDLKDKTYLSYDFYLPNYNILIEYQGIQHYKEKDFFGGEYQLKVQQHHDNLKRIYAKDNGYNLIEISYKIDTQDKIDTYLDRIIQD